MTNPKLYAHCSYIGTTGYNNHTRDFFRELSKYLQLKVRNFTVGKTWVGNNDTPHDNEPYINDIDKSILYKQRLWVDMVKWKILKFIHLQKKNLVMILI